MNNENKKNKPKISDSLIATMTNLLNKLDYKKIKDSDFGVSKLGESTTSSMSSYTDKMVPKEQKPKETKVGSVNTAFFSTIVSGSSEKMRVGDKLATIAAKYLNLVKKIDQTKKLRSNNDENLERKSYLEEKKKYQSITDAISGSTNTISSTTKIKRIRTTSKKSNAVKKTAIIGGTIAAGAGLTYALTRSSPSNVGDTTSSNTPKVGDTTSSNTPKVGDTTSSNTPSVSNAASPATASIMPNAKETNKNSAESIAKLLEKGEATNYDQLVYSNNEGDLTGKFNKKPITEMTVKEIRGLQTEMASSGKFPSSALGKYQIIGDTLQGAIDQKKVSLETIFDEKTQDSLFYDYLIGSKRPKLKSFRLGESIGSDEELQNAQLELAMEFASVGVPIKIKKGKFGVYPKRDLEVGESFYSGVGKNRANITPEQSATAIKSSRESALQEKAKILDSENAARLSNTNSSSNLSPAPPVSEGTGKKISEGYGVSRELDQRAKVVSIDNSKKIETGTTGKPKILGRATEMDYPLFLET
jgi:hypothetical protein